MARMSAAEAGRKGGQSRSEKKLAAIRRNGFQPCKNVTTTESRDVQKVNSTPVLVVTR